MERGHPHPDSSFDPALDVLEVRDVPDEDEEFLVFVYGPPDLRQQGVEPGAVF